MKTLTIAPEQGKKGRSFSGYLVASIEADYLWDQNASNTPHRPIWAQVIAGEMEIRPLVANLRLGRVANIATIGDRSYSKKPDRLEFMKSVAYTQLTQRVPEKGVSVTLFQRPLFELDPGMVDPAGIAFCMLLSQAEVDAQVWDRAPVYSFLEGLKLGREALTEEQATFLVPLCPYFAAFLDRRTRLPFPLDPRFYALLMVRTLGAERMCLISGLRDFNERSYTSSFGLRELGYTYPVIFKADHGVFAKLLADVTTEYFERLSLWQGRKVSAQGVSSPRPLSFSP